MPPKQFTLTLHPYHLAAISAAAEAAGIYTNARNGARGDSRLRPNVHAAITALLETLAREPVAIAAERLRCGIAAYEARDPGRLHLSEPPAGKPRPPVKRARLRQE